MPEPIDEFETARMKARKLAALATRGVGGEREAAQAALEKHLTKHGMRLSDLLEEGDRQLRQFEYILRAKTLRNDVAGLAANCLAFVLQSSASVRHRLHVDQPPPRTNRAPKKKAKSKQATKGRRIIIFSAEVTLAELDDWRACFLHYIDPFLASRMALIRAAKMALHGFLAQHRIFAPATDSEAGTLTPEQMESLIAAMRASQGDTWERGAKLTHVPLLS